MAKSGRAFADRKKIEVLSAAKTVEIHDCGTIFITTGAITITLPSAEDAGKGWWCRITKSDTANQVSVTATSTLKGIGVDGAGAGVPLNGNFSLHEDGAIGSMVEIYSDGSQYYAFGLSDAANGFNG